MFVALLSNVGLVDAPCSEVVGDALWASKIDDTWGVNVPFGFG